VHRFNNILFIATHDDNMAVAFDRAVTLAENNQARLTAINVIEEIPESTIWKHNDLSSKDLQALYIEGHERMLEDLVNSYGQKIKIETKVLIGIPFVNTIREVIRNSHDLVVKVAKGENDRRAKLLGNDDMHLLRQCPCPVLLINPKSERTYHRILAAVDADDNYMPKELDTRHHLNIQTLEIATSLALSEPADLHIVYVWRAPYESFLSGGFVQSSDAEIDYYVEEVRAQQQKNMNILMNKIANKVDTDTYININIKKHLIKGSPRKIIPDFSDEIGADLMIIGTVARTGIPGFIMGNTAETILHNINCSVLAIKPPGFVSPIKIE
jgi:universal stress protein E